MGATSTHKPKHMTVVQFLQNEFRMETKWKLIKTAKKGGVVYCAIQNLEDLSVHAEVCLVSLDSKQYHNIHFKWVHEDMGPYECNCPLDILKLLTPRAGENSAKWRAKVIESHKKNAEANLKAKQYQNLPVGTKLLLYGKQYEIIGKTYDGKRYQVVKDYVVYNLRPSQLKQITLVTEEVAVAA